jgi:MtfA peptidase
MALRHAQGKLWTGTGRTYPFPLIISNMFLFKKWRRKKIANRPFPPEWLRIINEHVLFYHRLSLPDKEELQKHILVFLAEKEFFGCGGLTITGEIRITIAAQACVLLLHRETDYYPGLHSILVYPAAYVAKATRHLPGGIIEEGYDVRLGESWHRGSVVLSWDDVRRGSADVRDGHNVVFHEFAHQLDSTAGQGDSSAVLQQRSTFIAWARVLHKNFIKLQQDLSGNKPTLLGSYAGQDPAEFFAVATEYFFERPKDLQKTYPDLYQELSNFYHQNPADM